MTLDILRSLYYAIRIGINPENTKMVFKLSGAIRDPKLKEQMISELKKQPEVAEVFRQKLANPKLQMQGLAEYPAGTLGEKLYRFLQANNLEPDIFPIYEGNSDFDYFRTRMGQTHDFRHVLTGYSRDVVGEVAIQAFDYAQIKQPLPAILCAVALFKAALTSSEQLSKVFHAIVSGYEMGNQATNLFAADLNQMMSQPIEEVRANLNIRTA